MTAEIATTAVVAGLLGTGWHIYSWKPKPFVPPPPPSRFSLFIAKAFGLIGFCIGFAFIAVAGIIFLAVVGVSLAEMPPTTIIIGLLVVIVLNMNMGKS